MTKPLLIISGMAPGPTGVGGLISKLLEEKQATDKIISACRIIWGTYGYSVKRQIRERKILLAFRNAFRWLHAKTLFHTGYINRQIDKDSNILLIHPQSLGFKWCLDLINSMKNPVWLFLADSSFFCIRSYNYLPGETGPCTRCLGGNFSQSTINNCQIYPVDDENASVFTEKIIEFARMHRIKFIAQNDRQALLAKEHFGHDITIKTTGLWTSGLINSDSIDTDNNSSAEYDIVFHGRPIAAKGAYWAIELAAQLPEYRFLFPFNKQDISIDPTSNCYFKEMSWDSGLKDHIINCPIVLVPSLWSSPIEGALIKSISYGKNTAVVRNISSFSDELPDNVLIKLDPNTKDAATQMKAVLSGEIVISKNNKHKFLETFEGKNKEILNRLILSTST